MYVCMFGLSKRKSHIRVCVRLRYMGKATHESKLITGEILRGKAGREKYFLQ